MVDVPPPPASEVAYRLQPLDDAGLGAYREAAEGCAAGSAQHPLWIEAWRAATGAACHLLTVSVGGVERTAIPLEFVSHRGLARLRYPGGRHANGNFPPLLAPGGANDGSWRNDRAELARALRDALPGLDMLALERQQRVLAGRSHPLIDLATGESPNIALAASLEGGFTALLERANGKRKRKKRRAQLRRFEEAGGWRLIEARGADEIDRLFDRFLALKAERFRAAGIADVFADPAIQDFWRELFQRAALSGDRAAFGLQALEVGGTIEAVTGSSLLADRTICEFGAIASDGLAAISPGEFLFYSNIEAAAARGDRFYDFSVGDEPYKRSWCDTEFVQFDTILPLTAKGRSAAAGEAALRRAKRSVKANPRLWSAVRRLRRASRG